MGGVNVLGYATSAALRMPGVSMIFWARFPSLASAAALAACSRCYASHYVDLSPRDGKPEIRRSPSPDHIDAPMPTRGRALPAIAESSRYE